MLMLLERGWSDGAFEAGAEEEAGGIGVSSGGGDGISVTEDSAELDVGNVGASLNAVASATTLMSFSIVEKSALSLLKNFFIRVHARFMFLIEVLELTLCM